MLIKHPKGVVEDVVMQIEKLLFPSNFVTLDIQRKIQLQQEFQCYRRRENINSKSLQRGTLERWLPNKRKRKEDV